MKILLTAAILTIVLGMPALADRDDRGGDRDRDQGKVVSDWIQDRGHELGQEISDWFRDEDRDRRGGHEMHGAPGPIAGAGLPVLAIGYGVYWLVKRRRKAN
jgi:hypothetical protein